VELFQSKLAKGDDKTATKTVSDYRARFPRHADLCLTDPDVRLRLEQLLVWSKIFLDIYCSKKSDETQHPFFSQNVTTRVLFYVLAYTMTDQLLHNEKNPDSIGVPIVDVLAAMSKAENKSIRSCERILKRAIESEHVFKAHWRYDKRESLIWVNPKHVNGYMTNALHHIDRIVLEAGWRQTRNKVFHRWEQDSKWHDKMAGRLVDALKVTSA
jgi:hypothetical protein